MFAQINLDFCFLFVRFSFIQIWSRPQLSIPRISNALWREILSRNMTTYNANL